MRTTVSILLLCVVILTACSKPDARVRPGGTLSEVERRALIAMDQAFVDWVPTHSAVWRTNGIFHHVCLRDTFVSDLGCLYEVITFDQHGQVLEANYMRLDSTLRMAFVEGVFPVKIKCIVWDRSFIAGVVHAPEEGRQALVAAVAHQKRKQG